MGSWRAARSAALVMTSLGFVAVMVVTWGRLLFAIRCPEPSYEVVGAKKWDGTGR